MTNNVIDTLYIDVVLFDYAKSWEDISEGFRFKSKPVEKRPYLVSCGRYIKRNPVRAGLTGIAWEYRWSVKKIEDALTDEKPYMGTFGDRERIAYGEALMSGEDETVVRNVQPHDPNLYQGEK